MTRAQFMLALCLIGCDGSAAESTPLAGPDAGSCASGQFLYLDESCPPPGAVLTGPSSQCEPEGDNLCHERCTSDSDCRDPARRYCRVLGLYANYDSNCNVGVRICRETDRDDCPATPVQLR
jgi:hypothetical protein